MGTLIDEFLKGIIPNALMMGMVIVIAWLLNRFESSTKEAGAKTERLITYIEDNAEVLRDIVVKNTTTAELLRVSVDAMRQSVEGMRNSVEVNTIALKEQRSSMTANTAATDKNTYDRK